MAYAICKRCSRPWHYTKRRGFSLKEARCPSCKSKGLVPAMWTPGGIVRMPRVRRVGQDVVSCALCGKRRDAAAGNVVTAKRAFMSGMAVHGDRIFPVGTRYCASHMGTERFIYAEAEETAAIDGSHEAG